MRQVMTVHQAVHLHRAREFARSHLGQVTQKILQQAGLIVG